MLVKATARLRYVSIPPRKMRLVAGIVKNLPVEKALSILNFTPRLAALHIAKTVKSAAANALSLEGTDRLKPESLQIRKITVDAAPTAKRIRFQSMGRAFRYRKRFCHLTVEVAGETEVAQTGRTAAQKDREKQETSSGKTGKTRSKSKTKTKTRSKITPPSKAGVATKKTTASRKTTTKRAQKTGDR